jgi:hypothetical protein
MDGGTLGMTNLIVAAASYPPLQRTQGRGTHSSGTGSKNVESWATRSPSVRGFKNEGSQRLKRKAPHLAKTARYGAPSFMSPQMWATHPH